jgi:hypothetical protein
VVRQYEEALAYLQVFEIEEAGSMIHLSQPEVTRSIITAFLQREEIPEL